MNLIQKTEGFLKAAFENSEAFRRDPAQGTYRLEHSYRVANIAREIAAKEGMDVTLAVVAGLLHDIAYCEGVETKEDWLNHGRRSAAIARPFLEELGLSDREVNEVCYGIAIHVDDEADFAWQRNAFSETVGDADNIDRFDVYRIYENLERKAFSSLTLAEKREKTAATLEDLRALRDMKLGTAAAKKLWQARIDYYIGFYERLTAQLDASECVL